MLDPQHKRKAIPDRDVRHVIITAAGHLLDAAGMGAGEDRTLDMDIAYRVERDGTLNDATSDRGYTIEFRIPWSKIGITPQPGMLIGINLALNNANRRGVSSRDWAGLTVYANPSQWKSIRLVDGPVTQATAVAADDAHDDLLGRMHLAAEDEPPSQQGTGCRLAEPTPVPDVAWWLGIAFVLLFLRRPRQGAD